MDAEHDRSIALLSIHPEYVARILSGEKRVEFRRSRFPRSVRTVVVYSTSPVQLVVALLSIGDVVTATPASLWKRFASVGGVRKQDFFTYYEGCECGRALLITRTQALLRPISLEELGPKISPPQSVRYLAPDTVACLREGSLGEGVFSDGIGLVPEPIAGDASRIVFRKSRKATPLSA